MNEIFNLVINNLSEVLITSLVAIVGYIFTTIGSKVKKVLDDKRIKDFVDDAVKCINQAYATLTNEEKYEKAKEDIINWLQTEGLKITETKLKVLIESAVANQKKEVK